MSRRAAQFTLILSLFICPLISFARAPQAPQASAAAAEANAQAAAAQASALLAASQQAAMQVTTAQNALRQAIQSYTKAPAGAAQAAAKAAVQQAQNQLVAAQTAARTAATQAIAAQSAAAQAAAQAAAAQAALARQAAATPAVQSAPAPTAAALSRANPGAGSGATANGASTGKGSSVNSTLGTVLGSVFGNGNSAGTANGGKTAKNGATNAANNAPKNTAGQSEAPQATVVADAAGPARRAGVAFGSGALGVGQSSDTLLTVYGCSRMGTQVVCDTDLSNQNNAITQVNGADQWKDVYLQDDAGDNHMRSMGVFENQNGDQRTQITLPYGEKSRYMLVFNGVPANVKSVTLKSAKDTLDVEGIPIASPGAAPNIQEGAPNQTPPAGMQPADAPASRTQGANSRPPRS